MSEESRKSEAVSAIVGIALLYGFAWLWGLQPGAAAEPAAVHGYLTPAEIPDTAKILGPPPPGGSGTKAGDVATYKATRSLRGTPRWDLATRDAAFGPADLMREFSCAAGRNLTPANEPALFHLLSRMVDDSETIGRRAKNTYKRPRPFVENGGEICVPKENWLKTSYSYPSGHSTFSWTAALILAEAMPEESSAILSRARSYGESRVVCGFHYGSDVQAGRLAASALFSALQDNSVFRSDLRKVRKELAQSQDGPGAPLDGAECRLELKAASEPVW